MATNRGVIDMTQLRGVKITLSGKLLGDVLDMLSSANIGTQSLWRDALKENRTSASSFWKAEADRYGAATSKVYAMVRKEKRKRARA